MELSSSSQECLKLLVCWSRKVSGRYWTLEALCQRKWHPIKWIQVNTCDNFTYPYAIRYGLNNDYGLHVCWIHSCQQDVDVDLFWPSVIIWVGCLNVYDTSFSLSTTYELIQVLRCSRLECLLLSVCDHNQFIQMSNNRLLIVERVSDPEI